MDTKGFIAFQLKLRILRSDIANKYGLARLVPNRTFLKGKAIREIQKTALAQSFNGHNKTFSLGNADEII